MASNWQSGVDVAMLSAAAEPFLRLNKMLNWQMSAQHTKFTRYEKRKKMSNGKKKKMERKIWWRMEQNPALAHEDEVHPPP